MRVGGYGRCRFAISDQRLSRCLRNLDGLWNVIRVINMTIAFIMFKIGVSDTADFR
jgi:hypothetical protein